MFKIKKILFKLIDILQKITPKSNILIFSSFPDLSDNSYALMNYLIKNGYLSKYKVIWLIREKKVEMYKQKLRTIYPGKDISVYFTRTIKALYFYLRARHVFYTHEIFLGCNPGENKKIDLCHGMPLKSYGTYLGEKMGNSSFGISTSEKFQEIMSKALDLPIDKILVTGQPRNDLLFEKTNFLKKINIEEEKFKKFIIWMPTYRKSDVFENIQGSFSEKKIGILNFNEIRDLNDYLEKKSIFLIIKLHPLDILRYEKYESYKNIKIIVNEDLSDVNEQLYPLLGRCDALITDYSSVYIDYLILNRPIGFMVEDIGSYKNSRGFIFEDPVSVMPGKLIENKTGLYEFFENVLEDKDQYIGERERVNKIFNLYRDNKSCERIVKELNL